MLIRQTFIEGGAILGGLIGGSASADESRSVRVHDQTVSARDEGLSVHHESSPHLFAFGEP